MAGLWSGNHRHGYRGYRLIRACVLGLAETLGDIGAFSSMLSQLHNNVVTESGSKVRAADRLACFRVTG